MLGGNCQVGGAHQGVRTGGVYAERGTVGQGEIEVDPFGATDPVTLHGADLLRPLIQLVQIVQ